MLTGCAELSPGAQGNLGFFEEKTLRVVQAQGRAVQPGQVSALRRVQGNARQPRAHGVEQVVTVTLQVSQQLDQPRFGIGVGGASGFQPQGIHTVDHAGAGVIKPIT